MRRPPEGPGWEERADRIRARAPATAARRQRGGFTTGLVAGLLLGLAVALGVALYVTKVPVPFMDKVPQRSADQDAAEALRNKDWDPNAPLASRAPRPSSTATGAVTPAPAPAPAASAPAAGAAADSAQPPRDPAAILDGRAVALPGPSPADPPAGAPVVDAVPTIVSRPSSSDAYVYFVQAGAFEKAAEAEAQRAKLGMLGLEARLYERNQSGRVVQRVRVGPFDTRDDAQATRDRLVSAGIEAQLLRAERATP